MAWTTNEAGEQVFSFDENFTKEMADEINAAYWEEPQETDGDWEAAYAFSNDEPVPLGDHVIDESAEDIVKQPASNPLAVASWTVVYRSRSNGGQWAEDTDGVIVSRDGAAFGTARARRRHWSYTSALEKVATNPDDPRWRCATWLAETREMAFDGIWPSFASLGISGKPLLLADPNGVTVHVAWPIPNNGGVIFTIDNGGAACGHCIGCAATEINNAQSPVCWVYFIQAADSGAIKIGFSTNPKGRLARLQTGHPSVLKLIGKIPGGAAVERTLHESFAKDRARDKGEWFLPSPALMAFIREIGGRHA